MKWQLISFIKRIFSQSLVSVYISARGVVCLKSTVRNCWDLDIKTSKYGAFTNSVDPDETSNNETPNQDLCYLPCYGAFTNSVDPDKTSHDVTFHQGLCFLPCYAHIWYM